MYEGDGFGHEGENCTFETLCLRFGIRDKVVHRIGQAIHDADSTTASLVERKASPSTTF